MQSLTSSRKNMGSGYNHHHHHNKNLQLQRSRLTFLPMLCSRPSIKDVANPKLERRSISFSTDPLSPKIGCMGQVKRHSKIAGFPTPNKITTAATKSDSNTSSPPVKYSKLRRIFSAKNSPINTIRSIPNDTTACRREGAVILKGARRPKSKEDTRKNHYLSVKVEDMDPPLPVIQKVQKPAVNGEEVDTIWKRRSRGITLKNLQLQQIPLTRHNLAPTTL